MAKTDRTDHYDALASGTAPAEVRVRGTSTTAGWRTGGRATDLVVFQAGMPVLDRDLNLTQLALDDRWAAVLGHQCPSGWLRASRRVSPAADLVVGAAPPIKDLTGKGVVAGGRLRDGIAIPKLAALVAGTPVVVEYTGTDTAGWNLVPLDPPTLYDGTPHTVKRTDFVFLEVWRSLIAPAGQAGASVTVLDAVALSDGDTITIGGIFVLTARKTPALPGDFRLGATPEADALAIEAAAGDPAWPGSAFVTARANGAEVDFHIAVGGAAGNTATLSVSTAQPGVLKTSGATFSGGYDQPGRPDQASVYRHGNVLSPRTVALPDEILDRNSGQQTCLRVQLQYRLRATGTGEAVSFRDHPDGFSSPSSGGGTPAVFAQGGRAQPVYLGNGVDSQSYPFVPADGSSAWLDSSAAAYGSRDDGLWVAGDGSARAAQDLGSVDGFVLALPVCFAFRRNDCSSSGVAALGWDPRNNANGAPTSGHGGYTTAAGLVVPAGRSDRPDGAFSDLLRPEDLLDLRRHASPSGADFRAELAHQSELLLRGHLRSWAGDAAGRAGNQTGSVGTSHLLAEEVGRTAALGGTAPSSGDTGVGRCARNLDHFARTFSGRGTAERACLAVWPGDRPSAAAQGGPVKPGRVDPALYAVKAEKSPGVPLDPATWTEGDVLHLDLDQMDCSQLGAEFDGRGGDGTSAPATPTAFPDLAPPGAVITDVVSVEHDDGQAALAVPREVAVRFVRGLGTRHVEVCLLGNDTPADAGGSAVATYRMVARDDGGLPGSGRRVFLEVEVSYPPGGGLAGTPVGEAHPDPTVYDGKSAGPGPTFELDPTQRPADFEQLCRARVTFPAREVRLEYATNVTPTHKAGAGMPGKPVVDQVVSRDRSTVVLPRRVFGAAGVTQVAQVPAVGTVTVDEVHTPFGSSERTVLTSQMSFPGQTLCQVSYLAQDPIPNYGAAGYQVATFYPSAAPQTAGVRDGALSLPSAIQLEVLAEQDAWVLQAGAGSPESDQDLPRGDLLPLRDGRELGDVLRDDALSAGSVVTVAGLSTPAGGLRFPVPVPVRDAGVLTAGGLRPGALPRRDAEGRAYYPAADLAGMPVGAAAQPLAGPSRHRVAVPLLCRVLRDAWTSSGGLLLRRSEVVLLVLVRYADLDEFADVEVGPLGTPLKSAAAIYKVEGNWMSWTGEREVLP